MNKILLRSRTFFLWKVLKTCLEMQNFREIVKLYEKNIVFLHRKYQIIED